MNASLDILAKDPSLVADLPPEERSKVILACASIVSAAALVNDPPPPSSDGPPVLNAKEAAEYLKVPVTWVREMARTGKLPKVQLGHYVRFRREDLDRFVLQHMNKGCPRDEEAAIRNVWVGGSCVTCEHDSGGLSVAWQRRSASRRTRSRGGNGGNSG